MAGEYTSQVMVKGIGAFLRRYLPKVGNRLSDDAYDTEINDLLAKAAGLLETPVPPRPPTFCTGCPDIDRNNNVSTHRLHDIHRDRVAGAGVGAQPVPRRDLPVDPDHRGFLHPADKG